MTGPRPGHRAVSGVRRTCDEAAEVGLPVGLQNHNHVALCADRGRHAPVRQGSRSPEPDGRARLRPVPRQPRGQRRAAAKAVPRPSFTRASAWSPRSPGTSGSSSTIPARTAPSRSSTTPRVLDILRGVHYTGFLDIVYEPDRPGGEHDQDGPAPDRRLPPLAAPRRPAPRGTRARGPVATRRRNAARTCSTARCKTETALAFIEGPTVDRSGVVYFTNSRRRRS